MERGRAAAACARQLLRLLLFLLLAAGAAAGDGSRGAPPPNVPSARAGTGAGPGTREPGEAEAGAGAGAGLPPVVRARAAAAAAGAAGVPRDQRGVELTFNETGLHKTFMFAKSNTFIQLDGDEIVHFQLRLCREIAFAFRTRLPHGLLVYHSVKGRPAGMDPYALYVIVEKGQLKTLHVFGKQSTSLVAGEALNDDEWHQVEVRIDVHRRQLTATVDGGRWRRESPLAGLREGDSYGVEQQLASVVLVGGLSPEEKLHGVKYIIESFVGCIRDMVLKTGKDASHLLPLAPLIASKHENVVEGCADQCRTRKNLCFEGSKCINHYNSLTCDCFGTYYEGEQCDVYTATVLTLRGSSYVSYRVYDWKDRVHSRQTRVSLFFKTLFDDSVLFYASGEPRQHYLAVSLRNGTAHVRMKIGGHVANVSVGQHLTGNHWHNLTLEHRGRTVTVRLDREVREVRLDTDLPYLYIDPEIYFGGGPKPHDKPGLESTNNFVGSLKYAFFNDVSVLYELHRGNPKVHYIGVLPPELREADVEVIPLTFPFHSSHLWLPLPDPVRLRLAFDFKSSRGSAVLASAALAPQEPAANRSGYWEVRLQGDEVRFELVLDPAAPDRALSLPVKFDGRPDWHAVELEMDAGAAALTVDYRHRESRPFGPRLRSAGRLRLAIGSGSRNIGLIGCLRDIRVDGRVLEARALAHSAHAVKEVSLDDCRLVDPCARPNTCEHGGRCSIQDERVVCDCTGTDYIGQNCHFSQYRKTCEELALLGYTEPDTYLIDIDGNGPFPPAHVKCEFQSLEDSTKTIVEHNLPPQTDVRKPDLEDFSLKIQYREFTAEMLQELVAHSLHCSQYIKYECSSAPLELHSATWFLSSSKNDIVDYIGNVKRGACPCSVNRTCVNPSQSCNCDITDPKWHLDEGYFTTPQSLGITEMVFLQQKELGKDSKARITLGPLECVEANTQKYVVTFTSSQSYIEVPGWRKGDISFSFRTTGEKAILLYQPPIRERHPSFMVALTSDFHLMFNFTLNTGHWRELEIKSKRRLNSGEWQKIWIDYNEHHVRFMINTDYQMVDLRPEEEFGPFEGSMFIGGATEDLLRESSVRQGLIGCFRGLVVNGEILDIYSYMSVHLSEIIKDCKPSCDPNPCTNGAQCRELWSSFQCVCANPWAHEGQFCETNINTNGLTFVTANSYLKKNDLSGDSESPLKAADLAALLTDTLLLNLRTYSRDALVLYANDHLNNFVHLHIRAGRYVEFLFNCGGEIVNATVDYPDVATGKSVQIAVVRGAEDTALHVNGRSSVAPAGVLLLAEYSNKPWNNSELELLGPHRPPAAPSPYFQFVLGGFSPDSLLMYAGGPPQPGLVGCVRGLRIGNQTVDLPAQNPDKEGADIRDGCHMACDSRPCLNQGVCVEDFERAESRCLCEKTSYSGPTCSDETGAHFPGDSLVQGRFSLEAPVSEASLQLAFSSEDSADRRPLLLLLRTERRWGYYLLVALSDGGRELIFEEEHEGALRRASVRDRSFINGARHSVYFRRANGSAELQVDREPVALTAKRPVAVAPPDQAEAGEADEAGSSEVHVGGLNTSDPRFASYRAFTGCISNVFVELNGKHMRPIHAYLGFGSGPDEVAVVGDNKGKGIAMGGCKAFDEVHKPRPGPSMNISLGRNKEWVHEAPVRDPYKSKYSNSSTEEASSSTIIFMVLACLFVFIVVCALCEVYRSHRQYKKRLEREAEAAIMWPKSQAGPKHPSIKLQGFKPVAPLDKSKAQFNGAEPRPVVKNDYKPVPTSPPPEEQAKPSSDRKPSNGKSQEQELAWEPMPENTELILDKSLEDLPNSKDEDDIDEPLKPEQGQNRSGSVSKSGSSIPTYFPPIPEDETATRDSITSDIDPSAAKATALIPGASLSPVFLSEDSRTFGNPISYLGGPRIDAKNIPRASKESILSLD